MDHWLLALVVAVFVYVFLVRPWHLNWGATAEEASAPLPGDDLVPEPKTAATHAITIGAPPDRVWPWLVQLGQDRAGFYSYTVLENLFGCHMRNTYRIVPEWQHRAVGDGVVFHPKLPRVPVAVCDPERALVIGGPLDKKGLPAPPGSGDTGAGTAWAFVLRDAGDGRTRLIARLRGRWPDGVPGWLANYLFWEPAHFVMERRMLKTIKRLAEAAVPVAPHCPEPAAPEPPTPAPAGLTRGPHGVPCLEPAGPPA